MFKAICTRSNLTVDIRNPLLIAPLIFTVKSSQFKQIFIELHTFYNTSIILNFTLAALYSKIITSRIFG